MNMSGLSVRKLCAIVAIGAFLTFTTITLMILAVTGSPTILLGGLFFTLALFVWGAVFLHFFQKKLLNYTSDLCQTLDEMMNGNKRLKVSQEEESQLARITHRLERLYNTMQENQRKVDEEKSKLQALVSDISHQSKTSISNLTMINDTLISRSMSEEKQQEFLQVTSSQLVKLDFLIQAMVKISRLETGVIVMDKKPAPIYETLVAAINGVLAPLEKKQIILTVECPENLSISHDIRWTTEALYNLLDNAVKYTLPGGRIDVDVQAWEMHLKIDVRDTGKGIAEHEHAAIFKRFYRGESVREVEGVGIGLYLAREIIAMQGGYIKVVSDAQTGSTFSVFLPWL